MSGPSRLPGDAAMLQRAGFEPWHGERASAGTVRLSLVRAFAAETVQGLWAWLLLLSALLPPLVAWLYVWIRVRAPEWIQFNGVESLALAPGSELDFAADVSSYVFRATTSWLLLFCGLYVAPKIGEDARQGAHLLYFSRAVSRRDYLVARIAAPVVISSTVFGVCGTLVHAAFGAHLGWNVPAPAAGSAGWAISGVLAWPIGLLVFTMAGFVVSFAATAVAHGCSVLVRAPGQAPLLYLGAIAASMATSWATVLNSDGNGLARSLDLYHGLNAPLFFGLRLIDPVQAPAVAKLDAALGAVAWALLCGLALWWLQRFLARPPASRGRG